MSFLDWMKQRSAPRQDVAQRPEPSWKKPQAQEQHNPVAQMSESEKAKAREIGERINRATQYLQGGGQAPQPAPENIGDSGPQRQNQVNQDKQAPALTPTDGDVGRTSQEPARTPPQKAPEKPSQTQQRPVRGRGGWER
jgi:hypothetical protein